MTNRQLQDKINQARCELKKYGESFEFYKIYESIKQEATLDQWIEFVKNVEVGNILDLSDAVLKNGDLNQNLEICFLQGCDSKPHREIVINSGDVQANIKVGKYTKSELSEEYVNKHGAVVIERGSAQDNYKYILKNKINGLNKKAHLDRVVKSKDLHCNYICARDIDGADILAHSKVILESNSTIFNFKFAQDVKGANILEHLEVIAKYGSAYDNYEVLKIFGDKCDLEKHLKRVFQSDENEVKLVCLEWLRSSMWLKKYKSMPEIVQFKTDLKNGKIKINKEDMIY